ncbi:MAG: DUF4294 domain-containing protein, partial [Bacteroidia bacterium]
FALLFSISCSIAQTEEPAVVPDSKPAIKVRAEVVNGDTVPVVDLYTINVETDYLFKNEKQREQWSRIKRDLKIVYPYAILAAAKLKEYDRILEKMPSEDLKKAYLRVCEKDLRHEFEDELKDLTIKQGRLLMKLIDRETGKTTYDIVKQMRGSFQVIMWQAVARLFGNDMKVGYDPTEDAMIEAAIKQVEYNNYRF